MEEQAIAQFTIQIKATEGGTWQGIVEAKGETCQFQSENHLLGWLWRTYPELFPDVKWDMR